MPEKIVKQHYIALAKILHLYRTEPLDENILKASHNFCKSLFGAAKAHPDLMFAQPQLYKPQLPFIVNLAFNSVVLTCLFAVRNKFDTLVTIQLMCGSLSIYALQQSSTEQHYQTSKDNRKPETKTLGKKNAKFAQLLKTNQQHIWLTNYPLCSHIHLNLYPRTILTTPIIALTYLANKLALLCTPNKRKQPINFAQALKSLSLQCCQKWYALLTPLMQYPGVSPPGNYVRLQDGRIHIVLSLRPEGLVTQTLPTKQSVVLPSDKADFSLTPSDQVIQSYPCQQLKNFTRLTQWWGNDLKAWLSNKSDDVKIEAFDSILPMQTAPASLLVMQDQLNHINADMPVIVKAIEKEPAYAHQLLLSASISNRQKQPVKNIQHCLAMLGFERTSSILLQHSLLSRINQQYFPLQQRLLTFSQFFVFIAAEMAVKIKWVSPELARTTAYFVVSRLFTHPSVRVLSFWNTSSLTTFKVASVVATKETESLKNDAFLIANAWQQNKQILEVLQHYDDLVIHTHLKKRSTRQLCYLLGLSLTLAHEYYFSGTTRCEDTVAYFKAGLIELDISQPEVIDMMSEIVSSTNIFCQLE